MVLNRNIGLYFNMKGEAAIRIWAPLASEVELETGQKGPLKLQPAALGFWELNQVNVRAGDLYRINVNGKSFPDPLSLFQPEGVHGPSCAFDTGKYSWSDRNWKGIAPEDLVIYELHTGTFTSQGTFEALTGKLSYLRELGINAIELMPVAQFPGERNWGYDGVYPFAVQNTYGGPEQLQQLVDICHANNIAVILDVVYNHLGPEGNYLPAFGPVFTDKYRTPWGKAINFDDAWCDGIRTLVIENVLMWFRDFHIDGLRLDAVHAVKDFGPVHILQEITSQVRHLNQLLKRNHFVICESDLNDTRFIEPLESGGYGMDATWCDEFHHALHSLVTGEKNGYYSDFGDTGLLAKSINSAYVYDGIWSDHRKRVFGTQTTHIPAHKFVVFIQNHDQIGNRMTGERLTSLVSFEILKVAAGTLMFSPYIPMLFMGEEYAETNPFQYFTSHGDAELIRLVREGRRNEFKAFQMQGEAPDPDDSKTFENSKLKWDTKSTQQQQMFLFYRELIRLRKTVPALKNSDRTSYYATEIQGKNAICLLRHSDNVKALVVVNFGNHTLDLELTSLSVNNCQLLMNSADTKWGGPGTTASCSGSGLSVPAQSVTLWITH